MRTKTKLLLITLAGLALISACAEGGVRGNETVVPTRIEVVVNGSLGDGEGEICLANVLGVSGRIREGDFVSATFMAQENKIQTTAMTRTTPFNETTVWFDPGNSECEDWSAIGVHWESSALAGIANYVCEEWSSVEGGAGGSVECELLLQH